MQITYRKEGDFLVPNLTEKNQNQHMIGKYGRMRLDYLREEDEITYTNLMFEKKLVPHILEIQQMAEKTLDRLINQMKVEENVTEELKAKNQMLWVQKMNNIKSRAEEIVIVEIIRNEYDDGGAN